MKKNNNNIAFWVIGIAIVAFGLYASGILSVAVDLSSYITEWKSLSDGMPMSGGSTGASFYSDAKFDCHGDVTAGSSGIQLGYSSTAVDSYCTLKRDFYGKEVALKLGGYDKSYITINGNVVDTNFIVDTQYSALKTIVIKPRVSNPLVVDVVIHLNNPPIHENILLKNNFM